MNTTSPAAKNVKNLQWRDGATVYRHSNLRHFGVTDGAGRWLTFDGVNPYIVASKGAAVEVATTMPVEKMSWIVEVAA